MSIMMMLAAIIGAGQPAQAVDDRVLTLAQENAAFAFDLYAQIKTQKGNLFYSPYSISTALAIAYGGARGNTERQMAQTLHFALPQDALHPAFSALDAYFDTLNDGKNITLNVANSLWLDQSFSVLDAYHALMQKHYGANLFQVDFIEETNASRKQINEWVAEQTQKKIEELLKKGDIEAQTAAVLVNAIYFKGNWQHAFDEKLTKDAPFWVTKDEQITTPTMQQTGTFEYRETDDWQMLALPYMGEQVLMVMLLPKDNDGLQQLEAQLTLDNVMNWLQQTSPQRVKVSLPKFTMRFRIYLIETLAKLGLTSLSDFSGMSTQAVSLSKVIHEAFIAVNEQGTEAAAATAVTMSRSAPRPPAEFTANHPFIFFMVDMTTGSFLFVGRVVNPAEAAK